MKSQGLRPNNWVINWLSKKCLSHGSSSLSGSSEFAQTRKDRSEPLPIAKIASKVCREFMVAAFFSRNHWWTNSWLCLCHFSKVKWYKPIKLYHFRKTALKQKIKQILHYWPKQRQFISKGAVNDPLCRMWVKSDLDCHWQNYESFRGVFKTQSNI